MHAKILWDTQQGFFLGFFTIKIYFLSRDHYLRRMGYEMFYDERIFLLLKYIDNNVNNYKKIQGTFSFSFLPQVKRLCQIMAFWKYVFFFEKNLSKHIFFIYNSKDFFECFGPENLAWFRSRWLANCTKTILFPHCPQICPKWTIWLMKIDKFGAPTFRNI